MTKIKFKKIVTIVLNIIIILFLFKNEPDYKKAISKDIDVDVSECKCISQMIDQESRDATYYMELDCSNTDVLENISEWKKLPFTDNLNQLMFRINKGNISYYYDMSGKFGIPKIESGYYYFIDLYSKNHTDIKDIYSDQYLFSYKHGLDFIIVQYDLNNNHLYYLKYFS